MSVLGFFQGEVDAGFGRERARGRPVRHCRPTRWVASAGGPKPLAPGLHMGPALRGRKKARLGGGGLCREIDASAARLEGTALCVARCEGLGTPVGTAVAAGGTGACADARGTVAPAGLAAVATGLVTAPALRLARGLALEAPRRCVAARGAAVVGAARIGVARARGTALALARMVLAVLAATAAEVALRTALREALLRLQAGDHLGDEGLAAIGLDVEDLAAVAELGKGHGQAVAPGPAGAADAVRVVLG